MFYGIGNDIVEIGRIEKAMKNPKFMERVFTISEINSLNDRGGKVESFAGRFSVKEAISKAMGTGVRNFNLTDIEVLNDELGKPVVTLKGELGERFKDYHIEVSISHSREYATAVAIIIKK